MHHTDKLAIQCSLYNFSQTAAVSCVHIIPWRTSAHNVATRPFGLSEKTDSKTSLKGTVLSALITFVIVLTL